MHRFLAYAMVLLFIAFVPSNAQTEAQSASEATTVAAAAAVDDGSRGIELTEPFENVVFEVKGNLTLRCRLPNDKGLPYVWLKNNTAIEKVSDLKDRYTLGKNDAEFSIKGRAHEDDFGNYTCSLKDGSGSQQWRVRAQPHVKLDDNVNIVEKQPIKIQCKLVGKPYPPVMWLYSAARSDNGTGVREALGERVRLEASEQGVPDAVLHIASVERADAGFYTCVALPPSPLRSTNSTTQLRVKDMYAALWPFLGICAEVFVLCAIILVYEKRRTKPELDDSDTDNHDQKKS